MNYHVAMLKNNKSGKENKVYFGHVDCLNALHGNLAECIDLGSDIRLLTPLTNGDLFSMLDYGTYDHAIPLSYCKEHINDDGSYPKGIWCYDNARQGEFISSAVALNQLRDTLATMLLKGETEIRSI